MNFLAILLALLLEQARPLSKDNPVHHGMRGWTRWVRRTLDAGQPHHAWMAWSLATLGPALVSAGVYIGLLYLNVLLAFAWMVVVLYATLGFRQFSHHFTTIRDALDDGNEGAARTALAEWQHVDVNDLPRQEILRHVIEHSVVAAHRHVFGVLVCFVVFSVMGLGPAGAVFYRMAEHLQRVWRERPNDAPSYALQTLSALAWRWLDAVPVRVTALGFAVAGNFEEAVASWRQDAQQFPGRNDGVLLAATAGAINVRLGGRPLGASEHSGDSSLVITDGREPQLAHLASVVGLVWRSVVLWLLMLALVTIASIVG
jgi:adenosylcobinamide-phosphate synthase